VDHDWAWYPSASDTVPCLPVPSPESSRRQASTAAGAERRSSKLARERVSSVSNKAPLPARLLAQLAATTAIAGLMLSIAAAAAAAAASSSPRSVGARFPPLTLERFPSLAPLLSSDAAVHAAALACHCRPKVPPVAAPR